MLQTLKRGLGRSYQLLNQNRIARKLASWAALADGSAGVNSASDISRKIGEERAQLYETSTGRYYLPTDAPQDCLISCIKSGGVFEPEVVETAKAYMRPGSTVLDIGANFGQMSVLFSRFVGAGGQVHSFEADPFVYELLQKTLAANNCQNVTAHPWPGAPPSTL